MATSKRSPSKSKRAAPKAAKGRKGLKPTKMAMKRKSAKAKPATRKAPKAAPRKAPSRAKATKIESSAMPEHAASQAAARRAVARPTKAHHEAQMERQAEHDHQDPRLAGIPGVAHEGRKVQPENFGQFKNKAVARLDKPTNWFRRAAKPKQ